MPERRDIFFEYPAVGRFERVSDQQYLRWKTVGVAVIAPAVVEKAVK